MSQIDNQPLRYWNGQPVYLTMYLTVVIAISIVVTLILDAAQFPIEALAFTPALFLRGALWQPLTYLWLNPLNFFSLMGLLCFYSWGVEVEKYLGRRVFLALCGLLALVPVAFFLLLHLVGMEAGVGGTFLLVCGLLIALATLYPNMDYLGGWVPLKWFAFICIACQTLFYVTKHAWAEMLCLWLECLVGFAVVRNARGMWSWGVELPQWLRRKPRLRVLPHPTPRTAGTRRAFAGGEPAASAASFTTVSTAESEVDALLDKIARSGLASLSAAERERLEKARLEMLKKGS